MTLHVTERQQTEFWYRLSGHLAASELFPRLLPNSESRKEVEGIETEHETDVGRYDESPCPDAMEDEVVEFH
jgi:hypothetical protein